MNETSRRLAPRKLMVLRYLPRAYVTGLIIQRSKIDTLCSAHRLHSRRHKRVERMYKAPNRHCNQTST